MSKTQDQVGQVGQVGQWLEFKWFEGCPTSLPYLA